MALAEHIKTWKVLSSGGLKHLRAHKKSGERSEGLLCAGLRAKLSQKATRTAL